MPRPIEIMDKQAILSLVSSLGMFAAAEIQEIENRLQAHFDAEDKSIWLVYEKDGIEGVIYCVPEPMTNGTWNALMLLVRADKQNSGCGSMLMKEVERVVAGRNGRILMVETSGTDSLEQAQRFYTKCGFLTVARIPDFYDDGDDKIIFCKRI